MGNSNNTPVNDPITNYKRTLSGMNHTITKEDDMICLTPHQNNAKYSQFVVNVSKDRKANCSSELKGNKRVITITLDPLEKESLHDFPYIQEIVSCHKMCYKKEYLPASWQSVMKVRN